MISGISIISVPTGEIKLIDDRGVFFTTAVFCLFAYVWMYIVLQVWTKDRVTIVEAIITLIFFVILVVLAFLADKYNEYKKKKQNKDRKSKSVKEGVNEEEFYHIVGVGQARARSGSRRSVKNIPKSIENIPNSGQEKGSEGLILKTNDSQTKEDISGSNRNIIDSNIRARAKSQKVKFISFFIIIDHQQIFQIIKYKYYF